jgi:hypothetical protein
MRLFEQTRGDKCLQIGFTIFSFATTTIHGKVTIRIALLSQKKYLESPVKRGVTI